MTRQEKFGVIFSLRFKESVGLPTSKSKESGIIIWESQTPGLPLVLNPVNTGNLPLLGLPRNSVAKITEVHTLP